MDIFDTVLDKVADGTATVEDFNVMCEAFAKSARERIARKTRITTPVHATQPAKSVEHAVHHKGDNDPTRTATGQHALKKRIEHNQDHPEEFKEACELLNCCGDQLDECRAKVTPGVARYLRGFRNHLPSDELREWADKLVNESGDTCTVCKEPWNSCLGRHGSKPCACGSGKPRNKCDCPGGTPEK